MLSRRSKCGAKWPCVPSCWLFYHDFNIYIINHSQYKRKNKLRVAKIQANIALFSTVFDINSKAENHICCLWARASLREFWVLFSSSTNSSSTHTPLIFTVTHQRSQRPIAASPPFNCLHLRHSVCVAMAILQCSTHTVSPSLRAWSRLAADDAGRLHTSSLPLGRRPIFTTGHKVYCAAQRIYGTASNHSTARKTLSKTHPPFASQEHWTDCSKHHQFVAITLLLFTERLQEALRHLFHPLLGAQIIWLMVSTVLSAVIKVMLFKVSLSGWAGMNYMRGTGECD